MRHTGTSGDFMDAILPKKVRATEALRQRPHGIIDEVLRPAGHYRAAQVEGCETRRTSNFINECSSYRTSTTQM